MADLDDQVLPESRALAACSWLKANDSPLIIFGMTMRVTLYRSQPNPPEKRWSRDSGENAFDHLKKCEATGYGEVAAGSRPDGTCAFVIPITDDDLRAGLEAHFGPLHEENSLNLEAPRIIYAMHVLYEDNESDSIEIVCYSCTLFAVKHDKCVFNGEVRSQTPTSRSS